MSIPIIRFRNIHADELEALINDVDFEMKVKFGPVEVALDEMDHFNE